ncbi:MULTISPECIES: hypothetical protein [unclassified Geodermatophilus]
MTATGTPTPEDRPRREMSEDEKLIAQWEARHDVAARGSHADPLAVQHYLSRAHADERGHGQPVRPAAPPAADAPAPRPARPEPRRPWWRRLLGRP